MVFRSALTLKLLTFRPTGAIHALMMIGCHEEAVAFMNWVERVCRPDDEGAEGPLHVMYSIHGDPAPDETTLGHLKGYRGECRVESRQAGLPSGLRFVQSRRIHAFPQAFTHVGLINAAVYLNQALEDAV